LLVFGSKKLRVINIHIQRKPNVLIPYVSIELLWKESILKDWILDAQWLWPKSEYDENITRVNEQVKDININTTIPSTNKDSKKHYRCKNDQLLEIPPTMIAIAYAHNFVEILKLPGSLFDHHQPKDQQQQQLEEKEKEKENENDLGILYTIQSEEHCTLFCGRFYNHTLEDLMFASGTVFCQILIWKVDHTIQGDIPVLHNLSGHEGILFGVRWARNGRAICSVSDDRTIRIWDISDLNKL
jgi:WD40 repeat protein